MGVHYYLNNQNMNNDIIKFYDNKSDVINEVYIDSDGMFINSDIKDRYFSFMWS